MAIAHRGSRLLWPENTMSAFQGAVDLGYRFLETDLHATSDGVLVAHHDHTVDRTTSGTGKVGDYTLDELQKLDAGHGFERNGDHPHRGQGVVIPSLDEVMSTFPDTIVTLDLKENGLEPVLADLLARRGWRDRAIVGSFSDRRLRRFRTETDGTVATSAGPREILRFWSAVRVGRAPNSAADAFQIPSRSRGITVVDRKMVTAAHAALKQVHVWTINEVDEMNRLLDLGVDGIVTDRPDLLNDVLAERKRVADE